MINLQHIEVDGTYTHILVILVLPFSVLVFVSVKLESNVEDSVP
jgi:hypothetical protein